MDALTEATADAGSIPAASIVPGNRTFFGGNRKDIRFRLGPRLFASCSGESASAVVPRDSLFQASSFREAPHGFVDVPARFLNLLHVEAS